MTTLITSQLYTNRVDIVYILLKKKRSKNEKLRERNVTIKIGDRNDDRVRE